MTACAPLAFLVAVLAIGAEPAESTLATVNGQQLTSRDLKAWFAIRGVQGDVSPSVRDTATESLIDRELVRQFLQKRKTVADSESLAAAMRVAKQRFAPDGGDLASALKPLGLDEDRLKSDVALTLAWNQHAKRTISDTQIRDHWTKHRRRLDGSRLRVSQIFQKYADGESAQHAPQTIAAMKKIRDAITSGDAAFAAAAKASSQSPTAAAGGDLGFIGPQGDLPKAVSSAAYSLAKGDVSDVVLSPFGAHLVTVTDVEAGDLSLEDARPLIFRELAEQLWNDTVARERKTATIVESRH